MTAPLPKEYKCKICGTVLVDREHLNRHKQVHKGKLVEFGDPYAIQVVGAPQDTTIVRAVSNLLGKGEK
ncbi:hypothetical protein NVIE_015140 [Nitrososphaera viennensis EN76]|uniref:C2H2-type domain-containing protein n=1 Tax=Nitrososphaera viennensis EN76 TaxID=926571 RepID=A0A060HGM4_9ARCH|nr:hypothetical protein NVIE_015140 [Nitrososphaera viennensis EN76]